MVPRRAKSLRPESAIAQLAKWRPFLLTEPMPESHVNGFVVRSPETSGDGLQTIANAS